ncbi:unnamed protein product [Caenorhabditis sp. 36 PRJEB53466]|nr:unnamed protein product [Caenorhabditis sp. 36 PRJEB53466]
MRQVVDLKAFLSTEPTHAVVLFDRIIKEEDDDTIQEACQAMANYIRHSSVYKRKLIQAQLQNCSLLCRMYLSFQFHSFKDSMFPRRLLFFGQSVFEGNVLQKPQRRHHVIAVGTNRFFNLGVISDGSPVEEPRLVCVPPVTKIEMTNTHTVFLTVDNRLFGCGKASSFLPELAEHADGGYVALPTLIQVPRVAEDAKITEIRVIEGGSQFLIDDIWHFVGKCDIPSVPVSSNCRIPLKKVCFPPVTYQMANVPFEKSTMKIYLSLIEGSLYWDRSPQFNARKEIALIVNGNLISAHFESFQVLTDATVYASKNGLLKGKLEFWKNLDDGFTVKNGTVMEHFDTKYTLIALMEEVPGSIGTEFFAASPDGNNLIMLRSHQVEDLSSNRSYLFQSLRTHLIFVNRKRQCDPVDIPDDLAVCFHSFDTETIEYRTNRLVFEMMFPEVKHLIRDNEFHFPPVPMKGILKNEEIFLNAYLLNVDLVNPRSLPAPTDPNKEFVPEGTDPSMIWWLTTSDGARVPCHKYLLLLHSRQIGAMQRFNTNKIPIYGDYQQEEVAEESVEVTANATEETVRRAMRGMLNPATLYDIKTIELIECINFYDYHLMDELFSDSMHVLMETVTDFTLPFLYELFFSFGNQVLEGLLERPYLLFNSISSAFPPKELLTQFVERRKDCKPIPNVGSLSNYDSSDIVRYFIDLDQDSEDVVWRSIRDEFGCSLDAAMTEAMRRKDRKKAVRSRNNSRTYRPAPSGIAASSSPIPIRDNTKSGSLTSSIGSPIQSPLAFSMSPMTKSIPVPKQNRTNSISNSLEDFPVMGASSSPPSPSSSWTPNKAKCPGGRFVPKGTRFVNANQILKPTLPANAWKVSKTIEEENVPKSSLNFDEIIQKEKKLQTKIKTGFKKVQLLPHVETEELAGAQILEVFRREFHDEALICVELMMKDDLEVENEQIVWGNMPGLVRR